MRRYSLLHPLLLSFYSPALYRDVAKHWQGVTAIYLLLLLAICWIPKMVNFNHYIQNNIALKSPEILRQIPGIKLENGSLSIQHSVPYIIKDPDNNLPMIIIDTSGKVKTLKNNQATVLFTQHKILFRKKSDKIVEYDFSHWHDFQLDKAALQHLFKQIGLGLAIVAYCLLVLLSFAYRILQALLYAGLALLFAKITMVKLDYQRAVRLSIVAITPAVILATTLGLFNISFLDAYLIYFIISVIYLLVAVSSLGEVADPHVNEDQQLVEESI